MRESQDKFVEYYKKISLEKSTVDRFQGIRDLVIASIGTGRYENEVLKIVDIGCGTGVQAAMWARAGHDVHGLDINTGLIEEAKRKAAEQGLRITFYLGSADNLPWESGSVDVCLVPELLEHVGNWQECLDEFARILSPGGVLFLSTTNRLCPRQQEFALPCYSWYPGRLKNYCERLSTTSRPDWVNHAKYPAVNWFDFYTLKREFALRDLDSEDRFDIYAKAPNPSTKTRVSRIISKTPVLRFLSQLVTPYSLLIGTKKRMQPEF